VKQTASPNRYSVEAVARMARISALFSPTRGVLELAEIARLAVIPRRTAAKIIATMEGRELLSRANGAEAWALGPAWLRLADCKLSRIDIRAAALPVMRWMREQLNETLIVAVRSGDRRIIVECMVSTQPIRRVSEVGDETALHVGSSGRTILSGMSDPEVTNYLKRVKLINYGYDTVTDPARVRSDVRKVRRKGFLTARAELTKESFSSSAPIRFHSGEVAAALTITFPLLRLTDELRDTSIRLVIGGAQRISERLGYQGRDGRPRECNFMTTATKFRSVSPSRTRYERPGVRVIERAADILACFIETSETLTLRDITDRTGIHKATAFRIITTLVEDGILNQSTAGARYELGFFALRCADAILGVDSLRDRALPIMMQLRDELNETVVLARRRGIFVLNVDKIVSRHDIVETPIIGVSTLLHETPAGLAILSTFDSQSLDEYFAAASPSPTSTQQRAIIENIRQTKARGAVLFQGRRLSPILAAPIRDSTSEAVAAFSIAIPLGRANPQFVRRCLGKLTRAARKLATSQALRAASVPEPLT
jgi:DNA-binding IclR family transcriptional regulator